MPLFLAHASETHTTIIESNAHLQQDWFIALSLLVLVITVFGALVYFLSHRSKSMTYLAIIGTLFVAGVSSYTIAPIISVVALTAGMVMTLLSVLASLGHQSARQNKNKRLY